MSGDRGGHKVYKNCALLGYYAASSCSFLPKFRQNLSLPSSRVYYSRFKVQPWRASSSNLVLTFRENLSVPSSRVLDPWRASSGNFLRTFGRSCPATSVRNYHYCLRNNPEESSSDLLRGGSLKARTKPFLFAPSVARGNDFKNCFFGFATFRQYPPGVAVTRYLAKKQKNSCEQKLQKLSALPLRCPSK